MQAIHKNAFTGKHKSSSTTKTRNRLLTVVIVTALLMLITLVILVIVLAVEPYPVTKTWSVVLNVVNYPKSRGKNTIDDESENVSRVFPGSAALERNAEAISNESLRALLIMMDRETSSSTVIHSTVHDNIRQKDKEVQEKHIVWTIRRYGEDAKIDTEGNGQSRCPELPFLTNLIQRLNDNHHKSVESDKVSKSILGKRRIEVSLCEQILSCRVEVLPSGCRCRNTASFAGVLHYCLPLLIPDSRSPSRRQKGAKRTSAAHNVCNLQTQGSAYAPKEKTGFLFDASHGQWDITNSHDHLPCILLWIDVARPLPAVFAMANRFMVKNLARSRLAERKFAYQTDTR